MKGYGPKSLIKVHNKHIIDHQISTCSALFKKPEFVVIGGYEFEKLKSVCNYKNVKFVKNSQYYIYNICYTFKVGLPYLNKTKQLLIIYGDIFFNKETLSDLSYKESFLLYDSKNRINKKSPGCTIVDNNVTYLDYGLNNKWCQILYLCGHELDIFKQVINEPSKKNYYGFEIINEIINNKGIIKAYEPDRMKLVEIDHYRDIKRASLIL